MATLIGQQVISVATKSLKLAATALSVHDPTTWWPQNRSSHQPHELKQYTLEEVSWHWEPNDCWMVVYDKVYDLTDFLSEHPGGYEVLLEHAGRDATIAFQGVGHSQQAMADMDKYCIGVLVEEERLSLTS